ncbi:UDP-N-acetylglucosamine 1-carboxyvinyltransferase [Feifania hominis]|uniref:UDP-N-acetylglucosamine 1-carboxyvinyltransferase n=1 Tax=Feifania hominis TaxID=2763660 RepID=A0A926DEZ9_9FIRM|nr:UDP-N-acetylglucosamine 1-carboxyvinyltransferase [Feifania hominis]MBC8536923.1 UDP-N-acetylglucosamine 1-carboxyvinyltransferase [Feifania hominis]
MVIVTLEKYVIEGGKPLYGDIQISGAKNAAVAILPATVLIEGVCRIENIPNILDVKKIVDILYQMGAQVRLINKNTIEIDTTNIKNMAPPYDMVRSMRASYYLLGAMLGRFHEAQVAMPGGCNFGVRPIDQHIKGFEAMGVSVSVEPGGLIDARVAEGTLHGGGSIYLDVVSVGATMNIMLAAARAEGTTIIENAAKEPHIVDLANFLNSMGADVKGAGTDSIKINGVKALHGGTYSIIPDQIEAGTYMALAAATGGEVSINNIIPKHMESITAKLIEMGVEVEEGDDSIVVRRDPAKRLERVNIKTMPYPGFPTDMQPQMAILLTLADGIGIITEGVWDNRFRYVDELKRMGANIQVDGKIAVFEGVDHLIPAPVKACDLRAGAAMVIAGLVTKGRTEVEDIFHIERGYEEIVEKLRGVGADIRKITVNDPSVIGKIG